MTQMKKPPRFEARSQSNKDAPKSSHKLAGLLYSWIIIIASAAGKKVASLSLMRHNGHHYL